VFASESFLTKFLAAQAGFAEHCLGVASVGVMGGPFEGKTVGLRVGESEGTAEGVAVSSVGLSTGEKNGGTVVVGSLEGHSYTPQSTILQAESQYPKSGNHIQLLDPLEGSNVFTQSVQVDGALQASESTIRSSSTWHISAAVMFSKNSPAA
jgi:hypothetical protein